MVGYSKSPEDQQIFAALSLFGLGGYGLGFKLIVMTVTGLSGEGSMSASSIHEFMDGFSCDPDLRRVNPTGNLNMHSGKLGQ